MATPALSLGRVRRGARQLRPSESGGGAQRGGERASGRKLRYKGFSLASHAPPIRRSLLWPPGHPGAHGGRHRRRFSALVPNGGRRPLPHRVRQRRGAPARLPQRAAQSQPRPGRSADRHPDLRIRPRSPRRSGAGRRGSGPRFHRHQLRLLGAEDRGPGRGRRVAARSVGDGRDGQLGSCAR